MITATFINLPVSDLKRSCTFFADMGFTLNKEFMDEHGAMVVIGGGASLMLLTEQYFRSFSKAGVAETRSQNEVIIALQVGDKHTVDELGKKAIDAGATGMEAFHEGGYMYGRRFRDLDGHIFEIFHMDMSARPETVAAASEKGTSC